MCIRVYEKLERVWLVCKVDIFAGTPAGSKAALPQPQGSLARVRAHMSYRPKGSPHQAPAEPHGLLVPLCLPNPSPPSEDITGGLKRRQVRPAVSTHYQGRPTSRLRRSSECSMGTSGPDGQRGVDDRGRAHRRIAIRTSGSGRRRRKLTMPRMMQDDARQVSRHTLPDP